jgi:hypothetical protein
MTPTQTETLLQEWFRSKHCTLWGRSFDLINNPDQAVDWFVEEVQAFLDYVDAQ